MASELLSQLKKLDPDYEPEAYLFVLQAMRFAQVKMSFPGHLSGQEFAERIVELSREIYGMLARNVFEQWGVRKTIDFGRIVYDLIEIGQMSKQPQDSIEDFRDVFDFKDRLGDNFEWDHFLAREIIQKLGLS